jgi:CRISPR/Cas system-associated endonuclease/helicase Cas3
MSRDEMVERVAQAIWEALGEGEAEIPSWTACRHYARVAIEAMYDYQADHRWTEVEQDADWWVDPPADVAP